MLITPTFKAIKTYHSQIKQFEGQQVYHEGAVRLAFQGLLDASARKRGWTLIPELEMKVKGRRVVPDGTLRDHFQIPRGYWEAKDTADTLDKEIEKKIEKGYPLKNTVFEDTRTGILFQDEREAFRADLRNSKKLADLLNALFEYTEPDIETFEHAVDEFRGRVPDLAGALVKIIKEAHARNPKFEQAYARLFAQCQQALNPNIRREAVDEMLVQHLLTIRLFRTIFNNPDFNRRNAIANELEEVVNALTSRSFSRDEFLSPLDRFYKAIEDAARNLTDFSEKQHFLNTVYERFFQGYSVKIADTHGIVYTPQPVVDFMVNSVEAVLQKEFGLHLWSDGVNILDPCTGTGNFIVNIINRIPARDLPRVYEKQLFANEVMLLPYYIAALNIEHAYYERTGNYEPFEGLCFVDTLDMAEHAQGQLAFMSEENTQRVQREKDAPITVIIGNPPYNMGQQSENDNNKNRKYEVIDRKISSTYSRDSKATLKNKLSDPYVKFFRWAVDRLEARDGIVCFVSNNSFIERTAFDGMRKHLEQDFTSIYHLDLHGNVNRNPKISGTIHNVFGIKVGVGITIAVRRGSGPQRHIRYHRVPEDWRKEEKLAALNKWTKVENVGWQEVLPDEFHSWILPINYSDFLQGLSLGTRETKKYGGPSIFRVYSLGVISNRDEWVYAFSGEELEGLISLHIDSYNYEVFRYKNLKKKPDNVDEFVNNDSSKLKWTDRLKGTLQQGRLLAFEPNEIRRCLYRPFTKEFLYFDELLNQRRYLQHKFYPTLEAEGENRLISATCHSEAPFSCIVTETIPDHALGGRAGQCFPFYVYDEDGSNRRENITDWALEQFRTRYEIASSGTPRNDVLDKWSIFYYVYGLLHHPGYREKYADCLRRELPRIPYAPDFWAFSNAGKELAHWHLDYEQIEPYELEYVEKKGTPLSYRVEKTRLIGPDGKGVLSTVAGKYNESDKFSVAVNKTLTLAGIPGRVFDYRLGNRSALEWVIDQYQISTDKRSGITHDPNRDDDPEYIVRLIGQVVKVSLETVRIVDGLPREFE